MPAGIEIQSPNATAVARSVNPVRLVRRREVLPKRPVARRFQPDGFFGLADLMRGASYV